MPSKDKKVVSAKLSEREYQVLEDLVNTHKITISGLISLCIKAIVDGEIRVENSELKTGVEPIGYAVSEELETPFGQKVEQRLNKLRDRGYPDNFIYSMKEQILSGLDSQIDMLPKKYDSRRVRDWC